jgi:hypothetical protein
VDGAEVEQAMKRGCGRDFAFALVKMEVRSARNARGIIAIR